MLIFWKEIMLHLFRKKGSFIVFDKDYVLIGLTVKYKIIFLLIFRIYILILQVALG